MAEPVITPVFRIAFVNLFDPAPPMPGKESEGRAPRYGCVAVWDEKSFTASDKKAWDDLNKAMDDECLRVFKKRWRELPGNFRRAIRDGIEKSDKYEGFEGKVFASLTTLFAPKVWDRDLKEISKLAGNTDKIYAGCYCRADVVPYTFDQGGGRGIALRLNSVQKMRDGERLDERGGDPSRFAEAGYDEQDEPPAV